MMLEIPTLIAITLFCSIYDAGTTFVLKESRKADCINRYATCVKDRMVETAKSPLAVAYENEALERCLTKEKS